MATSIYLSWLERYINYDFQNRSLLERALMAPGAQGHKNGTKEEQDEYNGNRSFAEMGQCLLPVALQEKKLTKEKDFKDSQLDTLESAIASERQIQRAKDLGLDTNMRLNPRQKGVPEPRVLKSGICAIIGAIWLDCGKDISVIVRAVTRIFGNTEPSPWTSFFLEDLVHMDQISNNIDLDYSPHLSGNVLTCSDEISGFDDTPVPIIDTSIVHPTSRIGLNLPFTPDFRASETRVHQEVNDDRGHPVAHTGLELMSPSHGDSATSLKRRKIQIHPLASSKASRLQEYIHLESQRCQSAGLPLPQMDLNWSTNKTSSFPKNGHDLDTVRTLFIAIGNPESLVVLQRLLQAHRTTYEADNLQRGHYLSLAERIKVIEGINCNIACQALRRRCHILQLFIDSSANSRRTSDGFVVDTTQSIAQKTARKIGNPMNLERSQISEAILYELYPSLDPNTREYDTKRRYVGNLRKLGGRFDLLVKTFGYGLMGLLPLPMCELGGESMLKVSDESISSLSDSLFRLLVSRLDESVGDYLREVSKSVSGIVEILFHNTWDPSIIFNLEQADSAQILQNPRGSRKLLDAVIHS